MYARRFRSVLSGLVVAAAIAGAGAAFAQSDFSESTVPPSAPRAHTAYPRAEAPTGEEPAEAAAPDTARESAAPVSEARPTAPRPSRPAASIPYTIRPGDTVGAIAQMFGVTADELARANRMHPDDELMAGEVLKVPHPFTGEVDMLKSQIETLSAQTQALQQKLDAANDQLKSAQSQAQELTGDNQELQLNVKLLPWWRATAVSAGIAAALMFGVMALTLFEWWRMRRKFVALAELTDALGRLDYKYKAMFAKAELRLQQLYGRRRGGITEGQPRPRLPEEIEIERLNEELKEILAMHLQRMGARLPGARRRKGWREMFGGTDVSSAVEARSYRR